MFLLGFDFFTFFLFLSLFVVLLPVCIYEQPISLFKNLCCIFFVFSLHVVLSISSTNIKGLYLFFLCLVHMSCVLLPAYLHMNVFLCLHVCTMYIRIDMYVFIYALLIVSYISNFNIRSLSRFLSVWSPPGSTGPLVYPSFLRFSTRPSREYANEIATHSGPPDGFKLGQRGSDPPRWLLCRGPFGHWRRKRETEGQGERRWARRNS